MFHTCTQLANAAKTMLIHTTPYLDSTIYKEISSKLVNTRPKMIAIDNNVTFDDLDIDLRIQLYTAFKLWPHFCQESVHDITSPAPYV